MGTSFGLRSRTPGDDHINMAEAGGIAEVIYTHPSFLGISSGSFRTETDLPICIWPGSKKLWGSHRHLRSQVMLELGTSRRRPT